MKIHIVRWLTLLSYAMLAAVVVVWVTRLQQHQQAARNGRARRGQQAGFPVPGRRIVGSVADQQHHVGMAQHEARPVGIAVPLETAVIDRTDLTVRRARRSLWQDIRGIVLPLDDRFQPLLCGLHRDDVNGRS